MRHGVGLVGTRAMVGVVGDDGSLPGVCATVEPGIRRRVDGGVSMLSESISILFSALLASIVLGDRATWDVDGVTGAGGWGGNSALSGVGVRGLFGSSGVTANAAPADGKLLLGSLVMGDLAAAAFDAGSTRALLSEGRRM